jgi:hypothetical protein
LPDDAGCFRVETVASSGKSPTSVAAVPPEELAMYLKAVALSFALLCAGCVSAAPDGAAYAGHGGCSYKQKAAAAQPAADDGDDEEERDPNAFAARAGGTSLVLLRVDGKHILGPNVNLGRYHEEEGRVIRGQVEGSIAELMIREDGVIGTLDNNPVRLRVERAGNAIEVAGLVPGRVSRFKIDEEGLRGNIGGCGYNLQRAPGGFAGRRFCGGSADNFTLELPDTMASWSDAEIAAVLVLFLRRG